MKSVIARLTLVLLMVALGGSGTSTQTVQLKRVMQTKLAHAQRILGDVVTNDWQGLQTDATALRRATRDPAWAVLVSPSTSGKRPSSCVRPKTSSTPQNVATWRPLRWRTCAHSELCAVPPVRRTDADREVIRRSGHAPSGRNLHRPSGECARFRHRALRGARSDLGLE